MATLLGVSRPDRVDPADATDQALEHRQVGARAAERLPTDCTPHDRCRGVHGADLPGIHGTRGMAVADPVTSGSSPLQEAAA